MSDIQDRERCLANLTNQIDIWIKGCLDGDSRCQEALYKYTYEELLHCTLRYAKGLEEGQWIFNLAMLKVYEGLSRFESGTNYLAWASTIVVRTAINHLRQNSRQRNEYQLEQDPPNTSDWDVNEALSRLESEQILSLVQALPERERLIFSMYEIDGFKHTEIAEEIGINQNTSRWLLAKAKKTLRKSIQKLYHLKPCTNE